MKIAYIKYLLLIAVVIIIQNTVKNAEAGPRTKLGTMAAPELLIPLGSVGTSLQGSNLASVTGIEAMYWNPAGLSQLESPTGEVMFSHMNYIADINMQYVAGVVKLGDLGYLGASVRSLSFGDAIQITTETSPEGTGATYSPTYIVGNLSFARAMTDRIHLGTNIKLINETIADVSATGVALDFGIQYVAGSSGLRFGIALKNLGPKMKFDGPGLDRTFVENGLTVVRRVTLQEFELPTNLEIGISYNAKLNKSNNVTLSSTFQNSTFSSDEYKFGLEYNYNNNLFLRGAGVYYANKESDEALFGPSFGAGLKYPFGNFMLGFDYAYRVVTEDGFNSTNQYFTLNVDF